MLIDSLLQFSDKQSVTATGPSANTIDFKQPTPTTGANFTPLYAVMTINETFKGITGLTLNIQDSDQETTGFTTCLTLPAISSKDLVAGKSFVFPVPVKHKRYMRAHYTVAGTGTAGSLSVSLVQGFDNNVALPDSPRAWGGK